MQYEVHSIVNIMARKMLYICALVVLLCSVGTVFFEFCNYA